MARRGRPLTRRPLRVLAALLLADGALVPSWALAEIATPGRLLTQKGIAAHVITLRANGIDGIETRVPWGYRLTKLPPDWVLELLLPICHEVKASWTWRVVGRGSLRRVA